ncbi:DUF5081 family protein [Listeria weihenstephanensis]|uniref:DUF5081 family protein n=1 Tax=Listeria weihenstephanensis TaxID=1006155 RepID=A0A841ZA18_9LIST|nr:DUF5081 family protein [Listeria weihenstephanensis]MBC1502165.1 DUF5081 family protein [Listeria weihenstephanensis]
MTGKTLYADELYYLAEYQDVSILFGIPYEAPSPASMEGLIKKEILTSTGGLSQVTVNYVELIRKYTQADRYVHIQQYIFALFDDGLCIILKQVTIKDTIQFELLVGDALLMLQIALNHPILKHAANKYFEEITAKPLENMTLRFSFTVPTLVMEIFDHAGQLEAQLAIGLENNQYYQLDEQNKLTTIMDIDPFEWFVSKVPQITTIAEERIKEAQKL